MNKLMRGTWIGCLGWFLGIVGDEASALYHEVLAPLSNWEKGYQIALWEENNL